MVKISAFPLAIVLASLAVHAAQAAPAKLTTDTARYQECSRKAQTVPEAALAESEKWALASGGAGDAGAFHCRAVALANLGRYAEAADAFERAGRAAPTGDPELKAEILGQAGNAWLLAGDLAKAYGAIDEAIGLVPDKPYLTPDLLVDRARVAAAKGDCKAAEADATRALGFLPAMTDAALVRAVCRKAREDYAGAVADLEQILTTDPTHPEALFERADMKVQIGDWAAARKDWTALVAVAPPDSQMAAIARRELAKLEARDQVNPP